MKSLEDASRFGTHMMVVAGGGSLRSNGIFKPAIHVLEKLMPEVTIYEGVRDEPTPETIDEGVVLAQEAGCDTVLAIGGGSVLDTGKAIAALVTNGGSVIDYLEGVGSGSSFTVPALPFIAVPTTAGTGSEVTKNAVITKPGVFKKSIRSQFLIPNLAIVDPALTATLPPFITATSGLDAFSQLLEGLVTRKRNPITEALCEKGLKLCTRSLLQAYLNQSDLDARNDMAAASLLSGLSLANSGLGAIHGFAAGLGAVFGVSHGLACAVLLPHITAANAEEDPDGFARLGKIFTGRIFSTARQAAQAGVSFIRNLCRDLLIPESLSAISVTADLLPEVVKASQGNSMRGNPVEFSKAKQLELLKSIL